MENEFFLNAASVHLEPSSSSSMPMWQSLSSPMDVQASVLNCSSEQPQDCFYNINKWEKSTDHHGLQFDSALSSMVSSPAASNSNIMPNNENLVIRELIGKLGNFGASPYINGSNSTDNSCYSTPLSSPPKMNMMNQLVKENFPSLGKSMVLNSNIAEFSSDPGFAERAAKFSCFGSRSLNGRTYQLGMNNGQLPLRSTQLMENETLARVPSSQSLKALGGSQMEVANSQEESTISEQTPNGENGVNANSRKRKASSKGKTRETSTSTNPTPKANETNEDSNAKRSKPNEGEGNENGAVKVEEDSKGGTSTGGDEKQNKSNSSKPLEPPKDYIHVRARRGQATDSHSLAERVRIPDQFSLIFLWLWQ